MKVCIEQRYLYFALTIVLLLFFYYKSLEIKAIEKFSTITLHETLNKSQLLDKIKVLSEKLHSCQLSESQCNEQVKTLKKYQYVNTEGTGVQLPSRVYKSDTFQQIGYVTRNSIRYPLYGRWKFPNNSNKWEYFIVDDSRNRLQIPFKSINDNEIYDRDTIQIDNEMYTVTLYEIGQANYY